MIHTKPSTVLFSVMRFSLIFFILGLSAFYTKQLDDFVWIVSFVIGFFMALGNRLYYFSRKKNHEMLLFDLPSDD